MVYSGAWGKLIHEKTRSKKSRDTVPLKVHKHEIFFEFACNTRFLKIIFDSAKIFDF
jgi:hypothetical protein